MLYFTFPWLFCNYQLALLNPFTFFIQLPNLSPFYQSFLWIYDSVSILCVHLFCSLDFTYKWNLMVFAFTLFDLLHLIVPQAYDTPMLSQMVRFHFFSWLSNVPLWYICTTSPLSSTDGHFGCFHILALVNNTGSMCTWKECIFCSFGVKCSKNVN